MDDLILLLEGSDVVAALPPTSAAVKFIQACTFFDGFTDGVEEEVDVGGKVNIDFDHKRITATAEGDIVFETGSVRIAPLPV